MSDAFTDIMRSSDIAGIGNLFLRAEELFLINPIRKNLNVLYSVGKELDGLPRGYEIFDSRGMGGIVSRRYNPRIEKGKKFEVVADDLGFLISRMNSCEEDRLGLLADIMTLGEKYWGALKSFYWPLEANNYCIMKNLEKTYNLTWEKDLKKMFSDYHDSFDKNKKYLEDNLTLTHGKLLFDRVSRDGKRFGGEDIDKILLDIGLKDTFPVKYNK